MYNGDLVKLRAYKEEDAVLAKEFINDYEVKRLLAIDAAFPISLWEEEEWVKSKKNTSGLVYDFAIETLKDGKYIGGCSINKLSVKNRNCTIGIMIGDKDYWSKGYGSDALKVLIKFIFEELNMNKIKLSFFAFNERAKACYKKVGFKEEGILKDEIFRDGKYNGEINMALFAKDYFLGNYNNASFR